MVSMFKELVARFCGKSVGDLNEHVKSAESTPPSMDRHMHAIPYALRMGELFPNYTPTDKDMNILANYTMNHSSADIPVLVRKIHGFDKYYTYSDQGSTLRAGDRLTEEIKAGLALVEDLRVRQLLSRNWYADDQSELVTEFPWLATRYHTSTYTALVLSGVLAEKAAAYVGVINGLRALIASIYLRTNSCGQLLVWASDYDRARYYLSLIHI